MPVVRLVSVFLVSCPMVLMNSPKTKRDIQNLTLIDYKLTPTTTPTPPETTVMKTEIPTDRITTDSDKELMEDTTTPRAMTDTATTPSNDKITSERFMDLSTAKTSTPTPLMPEVPTTPTKDTTSTKTTKYDEKTTTPKPTDAKTVTPAGERKTTSPAKEFVPEETSTIVPTQKPRTPTAMPSETTVAPGTTLKDKAEENLTTPSTKSPTFHAPSTTPTTPKPTSAGRVEPTTLMTLEQILMGTTAGKLGQKTTTKRHEETKGTTSTERRTPTTEAMKKETTTRGIPILPTVPSTTTSTSKPTTVSSTPLPTITKSTTASSTPPSATTGKQEPTTTSEDRKPTAAPTQIEKPTTVTEKKDEPTISTTTATPLLTKTTTTFGKAATAPTPTTTTVFPIKTTTTSGKAATTPSTTSTTTEVVIKGDGQTAEQASTTADKVASETIKEDEKEKPAVTETPLYLVTNSLTEPVTTDVKCPNGSITGKFNCYLLVDLESQTTTMTRSLTWCQSKGAAWNLANLYDLTIDKGVIKKHLDSMNMTSTMFHFQHERYVEKDGRSWLEMLNSTNWAPHHLVHANEIQKGASAVCKFGQFGGNLLCNMDDLYAAMLGKIQDMDKLDKTVFEAGEKVIVKCKEPSEATLVVECNSRGQIRPTKPHNFECPLPEGHRHQIETKFNGPIRKSCKDCNVRGTQSCQKVPGGFRCICKPEWQWFKCEMPVDQCRREPGRSFCKNGGKCVSLVDRVECECPRPFVGTRCDVNASMMSWSGDENGISYITPPSIASMILLLGMMVTLLIKDVYVKCDEREKDKYNPQRAFIYVRNGCVFVAALMLVIFGRPSIFLFADFPCRMALLVLYFLVFFSMALLLMESQNVTWVLAGDTYEYWNTDYTGTHRWWLTCPFRFGVCFSSATVVQIFIAWHGWKTFRLSASCVGNSVFYDNLETTWFMQHALHSLIMGTWFYCTYTEYNLRMNAEVWIHQLHLHDARWPNRLSSIESVWRNRRFQWILSPLLYLSYTSIAAAYDQTALTDAYDGPAIIFSLLFVVANFLQTVVVRDEILDPMMRRFLPLFPYKWLWPHLSPDLRLNHAEIIALKTGKPVKGEEEWPFHPRVKDFITEDTRTHYWRVLSAEYLTLRCQGLSVDHCVNKVADARRDDNEGPHSEAEQLRYMVKEWRRKVRAWDRYDLKMDRRKPKTKVQYMRQQLNRPMLSNVQIQEENRIVKRLKKIREALCYRPVQYMPIEMFAPSAKYGSDVVEWDFFKAESEPARLRWQLPALRAKFAKVENDPEFQKIFKENPTHGWTKMYNDNFRRGFTGKSKDPSPYDLPGAGDFVELLYLDGWFNSWEWDLAHKTHKKHQFAEWEANLDEEGHRNWELEKKERERLKKLVEDPAYDDEDKYVEEQYERFHREMNAYPNWKPKRKRTPEPYDRNTLACENTPERGPDGERPLLTDRESSAKKRRKLAIRQARIDKLL